MLARKRKGIEFPQAVFDDNVFDIDNKNNNKRYVNNNQIWDYAVIFSP